MLDSARGAVAALTALLRVCLGGKPQASSCSPVTALQPSGPNWQHRGATVSHGCLLDPDNESWLGLVQFSEGLATFSGEAAAEDTRAEGTAGVQASEDWSMVRRAGRDQLAGSGPGVRPLLGT